MMKKSANSKSPKPNPHNGKIWIDDPDMHIRQASGVQFGGRYVTFEEFRMLMNRRKKKSHEQQTE